MRVNRDFLKNFDEEEKGWLEKIMPYVQWEYGDSQSVKLVHIPTNVVAVSDWHATAEENTEEALLQLVRNVIKWNLVATPYKFTGAYALPSGEIEKILSGGLIPFPEPEKQRSKLKRFIDILLRRNKHEQNAR